LEIIPVINKIDLKSARIKEVTMELGSILGADEDKILNESNNYVKERN